MLKINFTDKSIEISGGFQFHTLYDFGVWVKFRKELKDRVFETDEELREFIDDFSVKNNGLC